VQATQTETAWCIVCGDAPGEYPGTYRPTRAVRHQLDLPHGTTYAYAVCGGCTQTTDLESRMLALVQRFARVRSVAPPAVARTWLNLYKSMQAALPTLRRLPLRCARARRLLRRRARRARAAFASTARGERIHLDLTRNLRRTTESCSAQEANSELSIADDAISERGEEAALKLQSQLAVSAPSLSLLRSGRMAEK
jgi:hypothetical protein